MSDIKFLLNFAQGGDLKKSIADLKTLNAELQKNQGLQKQFGDSFSSSSKSVTNSLDQISAKTKQMNDAMKTTSDAKEIAKLVAEIDKLRREYDKLSQSTTQMLIANQKLAQEEAKTRQQNSKAIREENKLRDDAIKKQQKEEKERTKLNSIYAMESKRLNDLRKKYKDLALSEGASSKETRKLLNEITALDNKLKQVDASVGQFQRNVGNYGSAIKGFGTQIMGAIGVGSFITVVADAVKTNAEFEQSLSDLSAITGATGKDLEFFRESAIAQTLSVEGSTASARDMLEAYKLIGSAKPELLENSEALDLVAQKSLLLADASGLELPDAVTRLTDAMNQFGAGSDQAGKFVDVLASGAKYGSAEIPQITEALLEFGAVAKSSNVSIQESTALIEALAEKGIKGSEAGTKLRNVLVSLSASKGLSKEAQQSFERLGIDTDILSDKTLTLDERLRELSKAKDDDVALLKIFGKENIVAAKTVLMQTGRIKELTEAVDENGVAQEQAGIRTDTLAGEWKKLGNAWDSEMLKIGGSSSGLKDIIKTIRENLGLIIKSVVNLAKAFAIFKTGQLAMKLFSSATTVTTTAWKDLNATMKANVLGIIAVAVYELANALGVFTTEADLLQEKLDKIKKGTDIGNTVFDAVNTKQKEAHQERMKELEEKYNFERGKAGSNAEELAKIDKNYTNTRLSLLATYRDQQGLQIALARDGIEKERKQIIDAQTEISALKLVNIGADRHIRTKQLEAEIISSHSSIEILKNQLEVNTAQRKDAMNEIVSITQDGVIEEKKSIEETVQSTKLATDKIIAENKRRQEEIAKLSLDLKRYLEDLRAENIEDEKKQAIEEERLKSERELEDVRAKYEKIGVLTEEQIRQKNKIEDELLIAHKNREAEINKKFDEEAYKREREKLEKLNELRNLDLETQEFYYSEFLEDAFNSREELREEYANAETDEERKRIEENFEFNQEAIEESLEDEYDLKVKQIEKQRDFELTEKDLTEEDKALIVEKANLELLKLEQDYNDGLEKLGDDRLKRTEKEEEKKKKIIEDFANETIKATLNQIEEKINANIDGIEEEINLQEDNIERQRELAERGLENTLAFEKQVQAENQARLIEEQKRLEKIKKIEAYYNLLASYAQDDPNTAPAKALVQIGIAEAIASRFEHGGIVSDVIAKQNGGILQGNSHRNGGILIEAEGSEGIFSKKEMQNLGKDNFYALKNALSTPVEGNFMRNQNESMMAVLPQQKTIVDFSRLEKKLDSVEKAIQNKPVPTFTIDQHGNMITMSETKKLIKVNIQKRKRF
jgi:TP901 family phage tail tape measure protein